MISDLKKKHNSDIAKKIKDNNQKIKNLTEINMKKIKFISQSIQNKVFSIDEYY